MVDRQSIEHLSRFGVVANPSSMLNGTVRFERKVVLYNNVAVRDCCFGSYSYVAPFGHLLFADVGRYCSIGNHVAVGGSNHPMDYVSTSPAFYDPVFGGQAWVAAPYDRRGDRVVIGSDVWLAAHCRVAPGVTIGHGAVVGMGAVVAKDVPPFAVVVGNPARIVRQRVPEALQERLTELSWWDYDWPASPAAAGLDWGRPADAISRMEELVAQGRIDRLGPAVVEMTERSAADADRSENR
jgi:hypothetical protein